MAGQRKSLERSVITFLLVFSAIAIYSLRTGEAEQVPSVSSVPSVYIVKEGDTLWNISQRYLDDPFHWPALWELNKYIKDPQWIYPGQPLRLKGKSSDAGNSSDNLVRSGHPAQLVKLSPPVQPETLTPAAAASPPPPEYLLNRDLIDSCGYILPGEEVRAREQKEQWGTVIDGEEDKISYSYPDLIYINKGRGQVSPGALFTVFRSQDMLLHPETSQEVGYEIQPVGIIEVKEVLDNIAKAKITKSFSEIHLQDRIKAYQPIPLPVRSEPKARVQGMLIASEDGRINLATQNVVFLDQGARQKVQAGNRFSIYRKDTITDGSSADTSGSSTGNRISTEKDTAVKKPVIVNDVIGELVVLKTEENTSTALITKSEDSIMVGYLFSARP
jgi:hypothetical protein